ncbi:MAG TPA: heat-inducible transcriptional repressor HrcA [Alphaproteobacteria bacterium]|jgi:heat-inducible transcriptional repressor|nr:heat-inducible transcriptional repressor HrcA [Alphaproteobacteria bacterium]
MTSPTADLNKRAREVLRLIVDAYVETGEPVGSRAISRKLGMHLSPATIRNVMADLEEVGLLRAPHTSAGRLPTEAGLRLFVHGLLQVGHLSEDERQTISGRATAAGRSMPDMLGEATAVLSGLSGCTGLVIAPKTDRPLKHLEFVSLGPGRTLIVMVSDDGVVENRVIETPLGIPAASLVMASNYLSARLIGRTIEEGRAAILAEIQTAQSQLDALTAGLVEAGLAIRSIGTDQLIVRGQSNLLDDIGGRDDVARIRSLFDALETKDTMLKLLEAANKAEGVQIFIGAENEMFAHAGCSMIITPYMNSREQVVGAIGVIGPTRLNYARIIPMVDYTAKVIGRLLG